MRSSAATSFFSIVVTAASIAVVSSAVSPANAYSVIRTNAEAGNPSSYLYDVGLNAGDVGRTLDPVTWSVAANSNNSGLPTELSAKAEITVNSFSSNMLSLAIKLTNTTAANFQSSIVSFGFGVNPDVNGAQLVQEDQQAYDAVRVKSRAGFPGGFKNIDVCVYGGNSCNGGDINKGLQSGGNSDTFMLNLFGNFGEDPSATLSAFPLKFQTAAGGYEAAGVPEPITVVGSGLALGFGTLFSKESAKKRKKATVKA
jgi:hypothetical protein